MLVIFFSKSFHSKKSLGWSTIWTQWIYFLFLFVTLIQYSRENSIFTAVNMVLNRMQSWLPVDKLCFFISHFFKRNTNISFRRFSGTWMAIANCLHYWIRLIHLIFDRTAKKTLDWNLILDVKTTIHKHQCIKRQHWLQSNHETKFEYETGIGFAVKSISYICGSIFRADKSTFNTKTS